MYLEVIIADDSAGKCNGSGSGAIESNRNGTKVVIFIWLEWSLPWAILAASKLRNDALTPFPGNSGENHSSKTERIIQDAPDPTGEWVAS